MSTSIEKMIVVKKELGSTEISLLTDIDGTVYTWQWLLDLMITIGERYPSRRRIVEPLKHAVYEYSMRRKDFTEVIHLALKILPDLFAGLSQNRVRQMARSIVARESSRVYRFPAWVIEQLKLENRKRAEKGVAPGLLIAITGSPQDIAEPFGEALGLHSTIGCEYFVDSKGRYTGERDERTATDKGKIIAEIRDSQLSLENAIGLGDSPSDEPIFMNTGIRFAINPNKPLLKYISDNPQMFIIWVSDGQKSRIHFFKYDSSEGLFKEVRFWSDVVLPSSCLLSHRFLEPVWDFDRS